MCTLCLVILTVGLLVSSTVGTVAQDEDEAPTATYVTGRIVDSFRTPPEPVEAEGVDRLPMLAEGDVESSDPRLPSRMMTRTLLDTREGTHPDGPVSPAVMATSYRLEGPDGAWAGTGRGFDVNPYLETDEAGERLWSTVSVVLSGEGDYEGLSAVLVLSLDWADYYSATSTFEGYIFEGQPPPLPEPIEPGLSLSE